MVKEHFEHIKVEKLKDSYKNELQKITTQIDMAEQTIGGQVKNIYSKKKELTKTKIVVNIVYLIIIFIDVFSLSTVIMVFSNSQNSVVNFRILILFQ